LQLASKLGEGARGRVYLAEQPDLANRPVVLKITSCDGREHLSLARLQHTQIVPLYSVQEDQARNLRLLCMPYFGGATLAQLLERLRTLPPEQRTGQHLVEALDQAQASQPLAAPVHGPIRQLLNQATYVQAVCWIGACLADALHYAHERGLVHLDLKPSNVLIAADGQPMLLDFHLARKPLAPDSSPEWLGGTPAFMSPEQLAALRAARELRPAPAAVDGRSDIYSLGLLLFEALEGCSATSPPLKQGRRRMRNPHVSIGLADVLAKCLKENAIERYPNAAALAADLRRHLGNLPLEGVPNRSLVERWAKWRRRRPYTLRFAMLTAALLLTGLAAGVIFYLHEKLARELQPTRQAEAAEQLHAVVDRIRVAYTADSILAESLRDLEGPCWTAWQKRGRITDKLSELPADERERLQTDLLDLAVLAADLRVQRASGGEAAAARHDALQVLSEAEELFGPRHILYRERQVHAEALGLTEQARAASEKAAGLAPRTVWEHCALGRSFLKAGRTEAAQAEIRKAVRLEPAALWPNYYLGHCAYRLQEYADAVAAFSVCLGAASQDGGQKSKTAVAGSFYNRGLAHSALGHNDQALTDYDHALTLNPHLGAAAVKRGVLYLAQKRDAKALADLERALQLGVKPATVHYNQALAYAARKDRAAALASARRALDLDPEHQDAQALYDQLQR